MITNTANLPDGVLPSSMKGLLNFESKLEKDLAETQNSLINHMKSHNLLSSSKLAIMLPIEECLHDSFQKMKTTEIPENKNYFAMSLKTFFMNLK